MQQNRAKIGNSPKTNMASTTKSKIPSWLSHAKENLSNSEGWKELVSELFEAVQQQLTENHVSYFSDLTDSEKMLFLDRASKLVRTSLRDSELVARVSVILDQQINESIMEELMNPSNTKSKTQLVLDSTYDACAHLLQKWPDMRHKLLSCLNRPLPPRLRKVIWEMFLANPKIRENYMNKQKNSSKLNIATLENAIAQRCEAFLALEPTFQGLNNLQMSIIAYVMKNCLIYKHLIEPLGDTDYLLIIPFIKVVVQETCTYRDGCQGDSLDTIVAHFIEVFFTFMEIRPTYTKDSGTKEFHAALKEVGVTMATILESQDHQLATSLVTSFSQGNNTSSLPACLASLMRSYLRSFFVGYLPMDVVCYIWDQYILSIKLQNLNCIPTFAVVLLILLKEKILNCNSGKDVEEALVKGSKELKTRQFQDEIDKNFMPRWKELVNNSNIQGSELPLVDPVATIGATQPWTWWFQEQPARRQRPEDRHAAREMERLHLQQQRRKEEIQKQKDEEQALTNAFNKDMQAQADKIKSLEQQLAQELQTRHNIEQQMSSEIRKLQEELARLKLNAGPSRHTPIPSASMSASLPTMPVSSTVVPSLSKEDEVKGVLKDLLSQATDGVNQLVHGTIHQKEELEDMAKKVFNITREEYKNAEQTLFGHELSKAAWDNMTTDQRNNNAEMLLNRLKELHKHK